jgi:ABC-type sugar transport system, periplasmic component
LADESEDLYVSSLIDEFEAAHPDLDIVSDCVLNDSYVEKIRVLVSTDALADVCFSWSGVFGENLARSGRVLALDDVMARDS